MKLNGPKRAQDYFNYLYNLGCHDIREPKWVDPDLMDDYNRLMDIYYGVQLINLVQSNDMIVDIDLEFLGRVDRINLIQRIKDSKPPKGKQTPSAVDKKHDKEQVTENV